MKGELLFDAISGIDPRFIEEAENSPKRFRGLKVFLLAACALMMLVTALSFAIPYLRNGAPIVVGTGEGEGKLFGKWSAAYVNDKPLLEGDKSFDVMTYTPSFGEGTVLVTELVEILDSGYRQVKSDTLGKVARLRVKEELVGQGFPEVINLFYENGGQDIPEGCEALLVTVTQVGTDGYVLLDTETGSVERFDGMFVFSSDKNYPDFGSLIPFSGGVVDMEFFENGCIQLVDDVLFFSALCDQLSFFEQRQMI